MFSPQDFQNLLVVVGLSRSPGIWRSDALLPWVYRELQNLAAFNNSVGTCHYFASQFKSAEFFALLGSISRINGWMIELP